MLKTAFALAVLQAAGAGALAQGPLRIGMTASDISLTSGQADNGGEGQRLMGDTVDDALINGTCRAQRNRPIRCRACP